MALKSELMAGGLPAQLARALGGDAIDTTTAPAGTNQATATQLTSTYTNPATVGSGTGYLLPTAENKSPYAVANGDGANAVLVYPAGTATINGAASFSVTHGKTALFIPAGLNWLALLSA